jgi:aspartate/tyrosine/aromatic aminotransferase
MQLRTVIRPMYSNPPRHGSEIAKRVLGEWIHMAAWLRSGKHQEL